MSFHSLYKAKLFLIPKNTHGGRELIIIQFTQVPLNSAVRVSDETFLMEVPFPKFAPAEEDPLPRADTLRRMCRKMRVFNSASHCSKRLNINGKPVRNASYTGKTHK